MKNKVSLEFIHGKYKINTTNQRHKMHEERKSVINTDVDNNFLFHSNTFHAFSFNTRYIKVSDGRLIKHCINFLLRNNFYGKSFTFYLKVV